MEFKDYYQILGVPRSATEAEIKKAFRKLARENHPDVAGAASETRFKEINEAYEVLSDAEKRSRFDNLSQRPPPSTGPSSPQDFHFEGTGFSDFFEQYFSGARGYGFDPQEEDHMYRQAYGGRPGRGADIEGEILVTLKEAMDGAVRPISLRSVHPTTGEVKTHSFQVRIPPGATDGRRIRIPGRGQTGHNGGEAGDLYLRVRHAADPDFSAQGSDIHLELEVAPWEAVLGAEIPVKTLDGTIRLRVPAGSDTSRKLRVPGRGLPTKGGRGDFYVDIQVAMPTQITDAEKELWEKLRATSSFNPRRS